VAVVVLDVKPIVTENCVYPSRTLTVTFADQFSDNITYYKCDVTKLEEVESVAKKVIEEVYHNTPSMHIILTAFCRSAIPLS
jgi:hypothetical protein